ncbi:MAG TPA: urease accessory protein UreE, partial [Flavisolibacter sp.]|nr:urease accessory protein UreE [Flavisolibacter sp.]
MTIKEKLGNLIDFETSEKTIDVLMVEWFETGKRIMQKKTQSGLDVNMRFLKENPNLAKDDVIYVDEKIIIVIDIKPVDVIVIIPESILQAAIFCYEIGNKHLPLYHDGDALLIPFDLPLFKWLEKGGFKPLQQNKRLLFPIRTSVAPHAHNGGSSSLFGKI